MRASQPSPWLAEMASGGPKPREWKSAATTSSSRPSALFSASVTGLPERRSSRVTKWSCGETSGPGIGDEDQAISFGDRALGLGAHLRLNAYRILDQPPGVDDDVGHGPNPAETVLPVTRESGHVRYDRIARAGQDIEQGRLADVRPSDKCNDGQHGMWREPLARAVLSDPARVPAQNQHRCRWLQIFLPEAASGVTR